MIFFFFPCGCGSQNVTRCSSGSVVERFHSDRVTLEAVFHMKDVRAEWALSILVTQRRSSGIELILFTHFWGNSFAWLSPHQLFFFCSHISCVSLRTHCSVPGWPMSLLARLAGYWRETCQATACLCLLPWFKQRGILTGLCVLGEVGYDERRLPYECTDSVTQNASALPLLWETAYPVQSFSVTPAYPFLCISAWEDERQ